jgi:L-rhamnose mutarotase
VFHPPGSPGPARRVPQPARRGLADAGWHDYSLFLRDDGLLVGYLLTEDFDAAIAAMDATGVNQRWQAEMAQFFVDLPGGRADRSMIPLDEVFHLETQLTRARRMEDRR